MQHHPPFVYLNSPNRRQNLLRHFPLPSQPQYYLTASPGVLNSLVAATSYRAMSTPGGQRLPGHHPVTAFSGIELDFEASHRVSPRIGGLQQSRMGVSVMTGLKKVR